VSRVRARLVLLSESVLWFWPNLHGASPASRELSLLPLCWQLGLLSAPPFETTGCSPARWRGFALDAKEGEPGGGLVWFEAAEVERVEWARYQEGQG